MKILKLMNCTSLPRRNFLKRRHSHKLIFTPCSIYLVASHPRPAHFSLSLFFFITSSASSHLILASRCIFTFEQLTFFWLHTVITTVISGAGMDWACDVNSSSQTQRKIMLPKVGINLSYITMWTGRIPRFHRY